MSLALLAVAVAPPTADAGAPGPTLPERQVASAPGDAAAEAAARRHLDRRRASLGVPRAALAGARVRFVHDTGRGGIIVVLRQTVGDIEVFGNDIKVLLSRAHELLAISGSPHPAAQPAAARPFALDGRAAVTIALLDRHGDGAGEVRAIATGAGDGWERFALAGAGPLQLRVPARTRAVYFPEGRALVPAYFVEVQASRAGRLDVFQQVIAADDGRVLYRRDAVAHEAYTYRVWAEAEGDHRPLDGPTVDFTPHPTGMPDVGPDAFVPPVLVSMEGFNTNPDDAADPWLPAGATETRGNNVDAYVDHTDPSGLDLNMGEFRAAVTGPATFDFVYDVNLEPLADPGQSSAAITQLFYVVNWLHDWWYDSGFDEAAGNAQMDNFGRGGAGGDPVLAEAQNAALMGVRNNASMATPADGASPVMQMFLWKAQEGEVSLQVAPLNQPLVVGMAKFGPGNYDLTRDLVVMEDAGGKNTTDGCEPIVADVSDKIVLIDKGGGCTYEFKAKAAETAGAAGVIIADNNANPDPLTPGFDDLVEDPTIPTQGTTLAGGDAMKAALLNGPQTARMIAVSGVERDGTIDNMIVAHEWAHFLHHRLVECASKACAAESEGWADFHSLYMSLRDGDDLDGTYANLTYVSMEPSGYFGIRRVPYSVDFTKNALTFRHIGDGEALPVEHPVQASEKANSEVHNAGEVWATMLWEAHVALHRAHPGAFEEVRRTMADYVVAGMILAPANPSFTEQRDALLQAIAASSADDFVTVAEAFARRGAGTCAESPPADALDFAGVVEDFAVSPAGALVSAAIVEETGDGDGALDGGEAGSVEVTVANLGAAALPAGATVEIVDADPILDLTGGNSMMLGALAPLEQVVVSIPVAIDCAHTQAAPLTVTVRLTTPAGCETEQELVVPEWTADPAMCGGSETGAPTTGDEPTTGGTTGGDPTGDPTDDPTGAATAGTDSASATEGPGMTDGGGCACAAAPGRDGLAGLASLLLLLGRRRRRA